MAGIADSKLSVVSPLHASSPGLWPDVAAQLGKGDRTPVASPTMPPPAAADTVPVSAPSEAPACEKPRKPNRGKNGGRLRVVAARVSADEYIVLDSKAREAGLSIGSYLRAAGLGTPGPRARRRPPINVELLAYAVAQLNRIGSNLNQIARALNAAHAAGSNETLEVVARTREAVTQILVIVGRRNRHDRQRHDPQ